MPPNPSDIINAFDEILDYVFGRSRGRDYAAKEDNRLAQEWIDLGLTVPIAAMVFTERMNAMHERWLNQIDHRQRTNIPATLKLFDENIRVAIERVKRGGEIDQTECVNSQWRSRIGWWKTTGKWNEDMWGMPPNNPTCRAPRRLLKEMVTLIEKRRPD